jgi:hypothetical protein
MKLRVDTIIEVANTLIGGIEPYGDEAVDENRYKNQEMLIELVMTEVEQLIDNSNYRNRVEGSMERIGSRAYKALKEIQQLIESALEESEE